MRIISGKLKGRKLLGDFEGDLRPTTDRNREALFSILGSWPDFDLVDCDVLDLCCGTGAVALEALSRGAKRALLVDKSAKNLEIAKKNAFNLNLRGQVGFLLADATKLGAGREVFDLVFIDPPYGFDCNKIVEEIVKNDWINENSLVIIESNCQQDSISPLRRLDLRRYGKSFFGFYRR